MATHQVILHSFFKSCEVSFSQMSELNSFSTNNFIIYSLNLFTAIVTIFAYLIVYYKQEKYNIKTDFLKTLSRGLVLFVLNTIFTAAALLLRFIVVNKTLIIVLTLLAEVFGLLAILFFTMGIYNYLEISTVGVKKRSVKKTYKSNKNPELDDLYGVIEQILSNICISVQNFISPMALNNLVVKHIDIVGLRQDTYFDESGQFLFEKVKKRLDAEPKSKRAEMAIMICNYFLNEMHIFLTNLLQDKALDTIENNIRNVFNEHEPVVEKFKLDKKILHGFFSQFVSTGITSLDQLLGGFSKGTIVLLEGPPEADKDLLGYQFLYRNLVTDQDSILLTTKSSENLKKVARYFGWEFKSFMEQGQFSVIDAYTTQSKKISDYAEIHSQGVILAKPTKEGLEIGLRLATENKQSWITLCLYSDFLNTALMKGDIHAIYPFLNEFLGYMRRNNYVGMFSIDNTMFDTQTLASIEDLCDICIEMQSGDSTAVRLKKLPGVIKHRKWMGYYIDDNGISVNID